MRSIHRFGIAAAVACAATAVQARDYAFAVSSAARPDLSTNTFAADQLVEFQAASHIITLYLTRAAGTWAEPKMVLNDIVYVVYHDGQIAKFKIRSLRDSIKVVFLERVPTLPPGLQKRASLDSLREVIVRMDDEERFREFVVRTRVPSVEVIQLPPLPLPLPALAPDDQIVEYNEYDYY